jgi:hypothetical protein
MHVDRGNIDSVYSSRQVSRSTNKSEMKMLPASHRVEMQHLTTADQHC